MGKRALAEATQRYLFEAEAWGPWLRGGYGGGVYHSGLAEAWAV